jgi:large subunit ribosomal protein L3
MLRTLSRWFGAVTETKGRWESIYGRPPQIANPDSNEKLAVVPFLAPKTALRTGLLAVKIGMTSEWDKWGVHHPLTVLQVDRCHVVQVKTKETDGYYALQLGVGEQHLRKLKKPQLGHFIKVDLPPKKLLREFQVTPDCLLPIGYEVLARHFTVGQSVDVRGITIGKGFEGGIKRWGFSRQPTSHGNSVSTRALGSTGNRQDPGRTFPGKKMPGHMGCNYRTTKNLIVYKVDSKRNLVYVQGAVPGHSNSIVEVYDSVYGHHLQFSKLSYPTFVPEPGKDYPEVETLQAPESDFFETMYVHDNYLPKGVDPTSTAIA